MYGGRGGARRRRLHGENARRALQWVAPGDEEAFNGASPQIRAVHRRAVQLAAALNEVGPEHLDWASIAESPLAE